jgi:hypothetical protein
MRRKSRSDAMAPSRYDFAHIEPFGYWTCMGYLALIISIVFIRIFGE